MEPEEINEFSKQLQEANEGGESLKTISLAISVLAVLVALVTVLGHRSHTEAVLAQSRAGDQWNEYQAKKIRSDQVSLALDLLSLEASSGSVAGKAKQTEYKAHQEKWKAELEEEQSKAREFEADVTYAEKLAGRYDLGEAMLQIGVVLCSITLFTRRRLYFYLGVAIGATGLLFAASVLAIH